jgi:hypothetical protein
MDEISKLLIEILGELKQINIKLSKNEKDNVLLNNDYDGDDIKNEINRIRREAMKSASRATSAIGANLNLDSIMDNVRKIKK